METYTIIFSTISLIVSWFTYSHVKNSQKPRIYVGNGKLDKFLKNHVPILFENYRPSWLVGWGGKIQTLASGFYRLPDNEKLPIKREILRLSDGGEIGLDYLTPSALTSSTLPTLSSTVKGLDLVEPEVEVERQKLVIVIFPGLCSTTESPYIKTLALALTQEDVTIVVANHRGLCGVDLKTPRTYCSTNPSDIREIVRHLKNKYKNARLIAIGTSLGGMQLCQYLIRHPEEAKDSLSAAIIMSIIWDSVIAMGALETPFVNKYIINYSLASGLCEMVTKQEKMLKARKFKCDWDKTIKSRTVREFDSNFIVPQFGYETVMDYYIDATINGKISKFPIPVFALSAADDPMYPGEHLPVTEAESQGSNLALVVTQFGGHLGFLESSLPKPFHFLERFAHQLICAILQHGHELT